MKPYCVNCRIVLEYPTYNIEYYYLDDDEGCICKGCRDKAINRLNHIELHAKEQLDQAIDLNRDRWLIKHDEPYVILDSMPGKG